MIFSNCQLYNSNESIIYKYSVTLKEYFEQSYDDWIVKGCHGQRGIWNYTGLPCPLCYKNNNYSKDNSENDDIILCDQCNNEYHIKCIKSLNNNFNQFEPFVCSLCKESNLKILKQQNEGQTYSSIDPSVVHPSCLGYTMKSILGRGNYKTQHTAGMFNSTNISPVFFCKDTKPAHTSICIYIYLYYIYIYSC